MSLIIMYRTHLGRIQKGTRLIPSAFFYFASKLRVTAFSIL